MVSLISTLRSIRFRLILVVILVVSALLFQTIFLVSTQDIQTNFENDGDSYVETDDEIREDFLRLSEIISTIENEHVATLLGDLLFKEEVNILSGQDIFEEFTESISTIQKKLEERQDLGYFIETESENTLTQAATFFQNPEFNRPIISKSESGLLGRFNEYQSSVIIDDKIVGDIIQESKTELVVIRDKQNKIIQDLGGVFENTTGFVSIVSIRIDTALNLLTNQTNPNELNRKLNLFELFRQISEYVSIVTRFEKLNLALDTVIQGQVEVNIINLIAELSIRENNITELADLITNENDQLLSIQNSIGLVKVAFTDVHEGINNVLNTSSISLGRMIEKTRIMIEIVSRALTREGAIFQFEFKKLLKDLDDDLREQTQRISLIIILAILFLVGNTAFVLVRYFNRYERNYRLIGDGKLNIPSRKSYSDDEIGRVNQGFDNMMSELKRVLTALQRSSERMAGIAEELAAGSEEASASVQEVSNTVREFSAGAAEQNLMLNRVDEKLSEHLKSIEDATGQINETSNFVLKVAKRTNILGLNASIEAAKAGKFGLGFNVVAEEVRTLSTDTKTSALEIADLIEVIETKIQTTIREIQHEVNITKDVAENTAAGSEEANAATSEQVVMLNEISQTSNELSLIANELQELLSRFEL